MSPRSPNPGLAAAALLAIALPCGAAGQPHRAFCPPGAGLPVCTKARLATPVRWTGGTESLDKVLRTLARRAFIPASVVVARPLPEIKLPSGRLSPAAELDAIVRTHRRFRWQLEGGVLCFGEVRLSAEPQNFLRWRLRSFTVTANPGGDMHRLAQLLWQWPRWPASVMEGFEVPIAGHPARVTLRHPTARAVLLHLLRAAPTFYSEIIFPAHRGPLTRKQALGAIGTWRWVPLTQPPIPPPPPPCGPYKIPPNAPPNWTPPPGTPCHPGAHPS
ncbi:MAG: hypothetical protein ACRD2F_05050 [Terriglobales bacterium]